MSLGNNAGSAVASDARAHHISTAAGRRHAHASVAQRWAGRGHPRRPAGRCSRRPPAIVLRGLRRRRAHRPDGAGHGAGLPGQPHHQLRPGRPGLRPDGARLPADRPSRACPTRWPWPAGLAVAVALGAATERVVIRRFAQAPRLLVTIATIGLSQVLAAVALLLPRLWDTELVAGPHRARRSTLTRQVGTRHLRRQRPAGPRGHAGGGGAGRRCSCGAATPASPSGPAPTAPTGRRCSASPSPGCRRWCGRWPRPWPSPPCSCAAASSTCPRARALGFGVLLRALAALLLGRLTDLVGVTTAAVALGVLELGVAWNHALRAHRPGARRRGRARPGPAPPRASAVADHGPTSPPGGRPRRCGRSRPALAGAARVRGRRAGLVGSWPWRWWPSALPVVLAIDQVVQGLGRCSSTPCSGVSLVLLSGWGGTVSLGQVAFFAIGAAVAGAVVSERGRRPVRRRWCRHGGRRRGGRVGRHPRAAAARALPGGHHLRLRAGHHVVPAQRRVLRAGCPPSASSGRRCSAASRCPAETAVYYLALAVLVVVDRRRARHPAQPVRPGARGACATTSRAAQAYGIDAVADAPGGLRPLRRHRRPGRRAVRPPRACLRPVVVLADREPGRVHHGRGRRHDVAWPAPSSAPCSCWAPGGS